MNNTKKLSLRLLDAIIDILSVVIFPFVFANKFKISPMSGFVYVIIFISLIFIYKDIFVPKRPNKYFDMFFFGIFLVLSIIFSFKLNALIAAISIFQLLLFILAKIIKNTVPLLTELIFSFITPIFLMIVLTYSLTKFLSGSSLILILLINTFALTTNLFELNTQSIFGICAVLFLDIMMYLIKYISLYSALSMFATLLLFVLIKYLTKINVKTGWARIILSIMQYF